MCRGIHRASGQFVGPQMVRQSRFAILDQLALFNELKFAFQRPQRTGVCFEECHDRQQQHQHNDYGATAVAAAAVEVICSKFHCFFAVPGTAMNVNAGVSRTAFMMPANSSSQRHAVTGPQLS